MNTEELDIILAERVDNLNLLNGYCSILALFSTLKELREADGFFGATKSTLHDSRAVLGKG